MIVEDYYDMKNIKHFIRFFTLLIVQIKRV